jgi:hypothetical protein
MTIKKSLGTVMACSLALIAFSLSPALQSQTKRSSNVQRGAASSDARSSFATTLERQMRSEGTDVRIQLEGDALDTLRLEWPTVHRSDIYRFVNSPEAQRAVRMGFTSVLFTNGSRRWEYNLTRESMVSSPENL